LGVYLAAFSLNLLKEEKMTTPMDEPREIIEELSDEALRDVAGGQNGCGSGPPAP